MPEDDTNVANSSLVRHSPSCCPAVCLLGSQGWSLSVVWVLDGNTCRGGISCCPAVQLSIFRPARDASKSEGGRGGGETAAEWVFRGTETTPRLRSKAADWCVKCTGRKNRCQKRNKFLQFLSWHFQREAPCSRKAQMLSFSIFEDTIF